MEQLDHSKQAEKTYPPSVLIVQGCARHAKKLKEKLEAQGCTVYQTDISPDGLAQARQKYFELIVFDVNRLDVDGLATCKLLRTDPELASVPLVILTPYDPARQAISKLQADTPVCCLARDASAEGALLQIIEQTHYMTNRYM